MSYRYNTEDAQEFGSALQDVWQNTEIGREYLRSYHSDEDFEEHFDLIRSTAVRVAGQTSVSDDEIARALYLLVQSGRIKPQKAAPAPLEEVSQDTRPRDRTGRVMSPKAIQWQKWERWLSDPKAPVSTKEIQALRNSDPAFREFYEHQRTLRLKEQPTDGFDPEATATARAAAGPELEAFAEEFNRAQARSLRPINGVVTLAGRKYPAADFNKLVEAASAAKLIF